MIQVTNNAAVFFKEPREPIYIYGTGNPGQWVSEYMERCHIEYEGFIDRAAGSEVCFLGGKKIIYFEELNKLKERRIRIIVTVERPEEALAELHWYAGEIDILCLYPLYKDFLFDGKVYYDINRLLSYFRRQLFCADVPTILSNNCNAGSIYKALGEMPKSPTTNTAISSKDFLKICKDPHSYLEQEIVFDGQWTISQGIRCPVGKLGDTEVIFAHSDKPEEAVRRWNKLKRWINWDNMVYILSDEFEVISHQTANDFCELPVKHLLILNNSLYTDVRNKGIIHTGRNPFLLPENAVEKWFDLLGWLNGEYEV